tara:strand:- start:339 stop:608 length:270 start_codon:yes stop_codon:yes gene_type:complete
MKSHMPTIVVVEYHDTYCARQAWCWVLPSQDRQQRYRRRERPFLDLACADIGFPKSAFSPLKRHFILTPAYGQMGTFAGFEVDFRHLEV